MRRASPSRRLAVLVAMLAACARAPEPSPAPTPTGPPVAPLPAGGYRMVFQLGDHIAHQDLRVAQSDTTLFGIDELLLAIRSPAGSRVAVAYRRGDSTRAVAIDAATGATTILHTGARGTTYSAAWSVDGERLGLGFQTADAPGGVTVLDASGAVRSLGCRAADRFEAWRSASEAIVQDGTRFYVVRSTDCSTVATVPRAGMSQPLYAPNGDRLSYYVNRSVKFAGRPQPELIPELWIAGYQNAAARVIADYRSRPRQSVWAPNGSRIVYEVVSRRWANTTHLVIYDIPTNKYSYEAREQLLGVPNDFNACWSADSRRIAHDRTYARSTGGRSYTTRQVVVREGAAERVVLEELIGEPPEQVLAGSLPRCEWIGEHHILVSSRAGQRLIPADGGETYNVLPGRTVLAVQVVDQGP